MDGRDVPASAPAFFGRPPMRSEGEGSAYEQADFGRFNAVSKDDEESLQSSELFCCLICMDRAERAQLVPCCSKIVCHACIQRWLASRRQCPHCRETLYPSQLVAVQHLVTETYDELERLHAKIDVRATESCEEHSLPFTYYCTVRRPPPSSGPTRPAPRAAARTCPPGASATCLAQGTPNAAATQACAEPVCSDCALFTTKHKGHDFQRLETVYEAHAEQVTESVARVRQRLCGLQVRIREVEANVELVNDSKEVVAQELHTAFESITARLQAQLSSKLVVLLRQKEEVEEDYSSTHKVADMVERQLKRASRSSLISQSAGLLRCVEEVCERVPSEFASTSVPHDDFVSELVPPYEGGSFVLQGYSQLLVDARSDSRGEAAEAKYSGSMVSSSGLTWRLKVYPNGNGVARDQCAPPFAKHPSPSQKAPPPLPP